MKTLNEFKEEINNAKEWKLEFFEVIALNGWNDETDEQYGICNNGKERLQFNESGEAEIVNIQGEQFFEVLGYKTKHDFGIRNYEIISEDETKETAMRTATREINRNVWYAVKWQSEDREEIEIIYS